MSYLCCRDLLSVESATPSTAANTTTSNPDTNKNSSKYKENRASSAHVNIGTGTASARRVVRVQKTARRVMAEKCLEGLLATVMPSGSLMKMFSAINGTDNSSALMDIVNVILRQ
jgi:hypothetical protein